MRRWQIYPGEELERVVTKEAERKGISISAELVETLEKAYGIVGDKDELSFTVTLGKIRLEVEEYIAKWSEDNNSCDREFTLYKASKTFAEISMGEPDGRLSSIKPRIGKAFRKLVDDKTIQNIAPARKANGEQKRAHNAAVYQIIKED